MDAIIQYLYSIKQQRMDFADDCRMIDAIIKLLLENETDLALLRKTVKTYGDLFGDYEDWPTEDLAIVTEIREGWKNGCEN